MNGEVAYPRSTKRTLDRIDIRAMLDSDALARFDELRTYVGEVAEVADYATKDGVSSASNDSVLRG